MIRRRGRIGFAVDKKHDFDLAVLATLTAVESAVREFDPDILHITGPSDVGQLGVAIAHRLRIPLAASWHTNVHQYAEQRASALLFFFQEPYASAWGLRSSRAACWRRFAFTTSLRCCLLPIRN